MLVLPALRNDDDVSRPDETSLLLGRDDPFYLNHVQSLVGRMNMWPRPRPGLKEDRDQVDRAPFIRPLQFLAADCAAEIFRVFAGATLVPIPL